MRVLVTCPPMLGMLEAFRPRFDAAGVALEAPAVTQALGETALCGLVPGCEGWILGDDPASRAVLEAGRAGRLRAVVKWGVGVDNVDFEAARELGIPVANTPGAFGAEVADVALGYLIGLARELFAIDRGVRAGAWPKPRGVSLAGAAVALVGFGDVGRALARRLLALGCRVTAYDPAFRPAPGLEAVSPARWPEGLGEADFLCLTCALTESSRGLLGAAALARVRRGVRVVNVARGGLVDEAALARALADGTVHSAALDVFEREPLPADSPLRAHAERLVLGSHNASNTGDAVRRASERAIDLLFGFLEVKE
jgi:D-3-phosphoglycerate dehydrogenase